MKIKWEYEFQDLEVIVEAFSPVIFPAMNHRDTKVARSVIYAVILKLRKKLLDEQHKRAEAKKKLSTKLEYHEAHFLERFLQITHIWIKNDFEINVIERHIFQLNQKLA